VLKRKSERRDSDHAEQVVQIVAFKVGSELYGLDILQVREIDVLQPITRVPKAIPFVEGVIHLRDMIIPVIDLGKRFGTGAIEPDRHTRVIIANLRGQSVGLIVSVVAEVIPIPSREIGPPPPLTFDQAGRFISGMARLKEGLISIINLDRLLSTEEVAQLQQQQSLF
jgi:purine-binding chemotaxis protein CheW